VELTLSVTAGAHTAGIGETLRTSGGPAVVRVAVAGVPEGTVTFHTEEGKAHREPMADRPIEWHAGPDSSFVRVEVRHPDGRMAALTNPVILV
jgi:hypothetical protein